MNLLRRNANRRRFSFWRCTLALIFVAGGFAQALDPANRHGHPRRVLDTNAIANAKPVMVNATNRMQTLIGFFGREKQQPPYVDGNRVSIEYRKPAPPDGLESFVQLHVVNMHAENLTEIIKRLGTERIEMAIIPRTNYVGTIQERDKPERKITHEDALAVITDVRIPREWFFYHPKFRNRGLSAEEGDAILARFPLSFRPLPKEEETEAQPTNSKRGAGD